MVSGEQSVMTFLVPLKLRSSVKCSISQMELSVLWGMLDMAEDRVSTATMSTIDFSAALVVIKISVNVNLRQNKLLVFKMSPPPSYVLLSVIGQIWLDNVDCSSGDEVLEDCDFNDWGINNCDHFDDVGVVCQPSKLMLGAR